MKKTALTLFLCLVAGALANTHCTQSVTASDLPKNQDTTPMMPVYAEPTVIDLGEISPFEEHSAQVKIHNQTDTAVTLSKADGSCPCSQLQWDSDTLVLGPHASLQIPLYLLLEAYPSDLVDSVVIIKTDHPEIPVLEVAVKAKIRPEVVVDPEEVAFGAIKVGDGGKVTVIARQNCAFPMEMELRDVPEPFKAIISRQKSKSDDGRSAYQIVVTLPPDAPGGRYAGKISLATNYGRKRVLHVPVSAEIVQPVVGHTPEVVVFGEVPPGTTLPDMHLSCLDAFRILSMDSNVDGLVLKAHSVEAAKEHILSISIAEDTGKGDLAGHVNVMVGNAAWSQKVQIPLFGSVR